MRLVSFPASSLLGSAPYAFFDLGFMASPQHFIFLVGHAKLLQFLYGTIVRSPRTKDRFLSFPRSPPSLLFFSLTLLGRTPFFSHSSALTVRTPRGRADLFFRCLISLMFRPFPPSFLYSFSVLRAEIPLSRALPLLFFRLRSGLYFYRALCGFVPLWNFCYL